MLCCGVLWCGLCCAVLCRDPSAYNDVPADTQDMLGGGRVLAAWQGAQVRRAPRRQPVYTCTGNLTAWQPADRLHRRTSCRSI